MEVTNEPLEWTSEDVANLRNFLRTTTGSRFIANLTETAPVLLAEGDVNAILIRSGELRGTLALVRSIFALASVDGKTETAPDPYPDLEKDGAWADGQKLQQSPIGLTIKPN